MRDLYTKKFIHAMQNRESIVYPVNVNVSYFFINILPIVIPTYLIVFFCEQYSHYFKYLQNS